MSVPTAELFHKERGIEPFIRRHRRDTSKGLSPRELIRIKKGIIEASESPISTLTGANEKFGNIMDLLIHPEAKSVMEGLNERLAKEYRIRGFRDAGLVLVGGSIASSLIKDAVGIYRVDGTPPPDIDLKFVFDSSSQVKQKDFSDLQEIIDNTVPSLTGGHMRACEINTVDKKYQQNLSVTALLPVITATDFINADLNSFKLHTYFYPSFPRQINENNRYEILLSLQKLRELGQDTRLQEVTDSIVTSWNKSFLPIGGKLEKYFGVVYPDNDSEFQRIKELVQTSQRQMLMDLFTFDPR